MGVFVQEKLVPEWPSALAPCAFSLTAIDIVLILCITLELVYTAVQAFRKARLQNRERDVVGDASAVLVVLFTQVPFIVVPVLLLTALPSMMSEWTEEILLVS